MRAAGRRLADGEADLQRGAAGHRAAPEEEEQQKEARASALVTEATAGPASSTAQAPSLASFIKGFIYQLKEASPVGASDQRLFTLTTVTGSRNHVTSLNNDPSVWVCGSRPRTDR